MPALPEPVRVAFKVKSEKDKSFGGRMVKVAHGS
jgi:hypothetical protein